MSLRHTAEVPCRAVFSLFAKTVRAKRGLFQREARLLEDGGAELGE
jgi:hypothetical protein